VLDVKIEDLFLLYACRAKTIDGGATHRRNMYKAGKTVQRTRASTHGHEAYKKKCPGPAQRARPGRRKGKACCTACMTRVAATNG
jgi:hypothetical protein